MKRTTFALTAMLALCATVAPGLARGDDDGDGTLAAADRCLAEFFAREVRVVAEASLEGLSSRDAWERERPRLRRELFAMLGLSPLPPRGDLLATVTGTVERPEQGIAVEKLHFQSIPGLYVTANLYRPLRGEGPFPAVLYLCGHGRVEVDGVSYGNKVHYQHHPAWFARNGYVCLVIDTLQLGELEGLHHGTYRHGMWWWVSRGYTPAGVEAWSSIRAIDYLSARPEVDAERLGVTGRSGGGIGTWWLAALDERPQVFVPVAGITDLENHVVTGCIEGHCDCNYFVNIYRWDYPAVAALAAPRPLLLANTDKDRIFPLDGVYRLYDELRDVYALYGAQERLGLCIIEGPHQDTQELRYPAFQWFERWLAGRDGREPIAMVAERFFTPQELRVFDPDEPPPAVARNGELHEHFVAASVPEVPASAEELEALRARLLGRLGAETFRAMPDVAGALEVRLAREVERDGLRLREFDFRSEDPFRLPLRVFTHADATGPPARVRLVVADDAEWDLYAAPAERGDSGHRAESVPGAREALVVFAPRGIGPTRWSGDAARQNQIRRRFLVLGRTLASTRVFDVRRALRALSSLPDLGGAAIELVAEGELAVVAAYAGLFEPAVSSFDLVNPTPSHREGVPLLNVLRFMDVPQALALLLPREVKLRTDDFEAFAWTGKAAALLGEDGREALRLR